MILLLDFVVTTRFYALNYLVAAVHRMSVLDDSLRGKMEYFGLVKGNNEEEIS